MTETVERYEVVKTLIRGKQSARKTITKAGQEKITYHKKPLGYVLKDLKTGKLIAMTHTEATEAILLEGAVNAFITATQRELPDGKKTLSPYPKAKKGCIPLQDAEIIADADQFLAENAKNLKVTEALAKVLERKPRGTGSGSRPAPQKYTKEELKAALLAKIKAEKEMLGVAK